MGALADVISSGWDGIDLGRDNHIGGAAILAIYSPMEGAEGLLGHTS